MAPPDTETTISTPSERTLEEIAQRAITTAHNWVLRARFVTDIWVFLADPAGAAYRVHGEVLAWYEIPSWLIPGAEERRASLMRRLTDAAKQCERPVIVHCSLPGAINFSPLEDDFASWLRRVRQGQADAAVEPEPAPAPAPLTPQRNNAFFPVFSALAEGIAQAAWDWATTNIDTAWVCLTDVHGTPRSTVLFATRGRVQAPEEVGEDLDKLKSATLMEWRDFVSAGHVGVHHPGMIAIRRDQRVCEIEHAHWGTVREGDIERWVAGVKASAEYSRRERPCTPRIESPPHPPPQPPRRQHSPVLPPSPVSPSPQGATRIVLPPTPVSPLQPTYCTSTPAPPLPDPSQHAAFLARFQATLATTLRAVLAWPLNRPSVSTMWVYLAHMDGTVSACVLMDDGKGSSLAALGGRDPAPLLEMIGGAWAATCAAGEPRKTHPLGVVLIVRPNAGPSLTLETSWEREDVDWPDVAPGAVWRRTVVGSV